VLIVMMSWLVFWIDPTLSSAQISVAVTSMLTLIAYRFAIGADVPKLPYLTLLDAFILLSSILVFLSLIEVMVTTALALNNRVETARMLDRHSRWVFPLVFLVASALLTTF
jgi:cadmium resistance protein CadD (predicted permease)